MHVVLRLGSEGNLRKISCRGEDFVWCLPTDLLTQSPDFMGTASELVLPATGSEWFEGSGG
ncbi:MAG: hypothetical protein RL215_2377 [Planctomycetota bacterium]|jgi:hypothetical protein